MNRKAWLLGSAAAAAAMTALIRSRRRPADLRGKVALITGGSRGLGLALARGLARQGCSIVLCARDEEELASARSDVSKIAGEVMTIACDVSDQGQVEQMVNRVVQHYGGLDILVNNAGLIQVGPVHTMSVTDFERAMDVMFWGNVYTSLAILPYMRSRGKGSIVNITSVGGKVSVPHLVPYSCAKFAAAAFSEGLRAELQGTGIKVVTIAPGLMRTGSFLNAVFKGNAEAEAAWFSVSSSLPGLSMSAARAADQIIAAIRTGRAERILSTPANVLARFHGLFPGVTADLLGMVNRFLPKGEEQTGHGPESMAGRGLWFYALTGPGRRAAREYLQPALPWLVSR